MPNTRMMLWIALAAVLYLNYEAWMHDYPAVVERGSPATSVTGAPTTLSDSVPQAASTAALPPSSPAPAVPAAADAAFASAPAAPSDTAAPDAGPSASVHVTTDVLDVVISLKGGELDQADLPQYPLR